MLQTGKPYLPGSIRNKVLAQGDVEKNLAKWPFPLSEQVKQEVRALARQLETV